MKNGLRVRCSLKEFTCLQHSNKCGGGMVARFKLHRILKRVKEYVIDVKYVLGCVSRSLFEHEELMLCSVLSCYQVHFLFTLF